MIKEIKFIHNNKILFNKKFIPSCSGYISGEYEYFYYDDYTTNSFPMNSYCIDWEIRSFRNDPEIIYYGLVRSEYYHHTGFRTMVILK